MIGFCPGGKMNNPTTQKVCTAPNCSKEQFSKTWCQAHYTRMYRYGSLDRPQKYPECAVSHCDKYMMKWSTVCKSCYQKSWRYGLTAEQFIEMSRPENYHCYNPGCSSNEKLHIDHDHSCCLEASSLRGGKKACGQCVRGWLCNGCNTALGLLKEDTGRIAGLIEYLRR